ncbi:MAG: DUF4139 domain-containing protein [Planctomycetota bacterium]
MTHLNEDKLIQYAFDLMDAGDRETAQQHLDDCGDCRAALDALKQKFAAMESLAGEVPPSEELIAQTLAVKDTAKTIPLYRRVWVGWSAAAAAVVLMGTLMLHNLPVTPTKSSPPAKGQYRAAGRGSFPDDRMASLSEAAQGSVGTAHPTEGIRVVSADEIPDKPPFAPASAIELVVLPKPDKTQVTIYNSKDLTLVRDTRKLTLKPGWNWIQFMWANTQIDPTSLSLTPLTHADKVDIQLISYPARLKDIGRWLIRSEVEGAVPFEITYFASGLSWRAFYMGTMNEDETTMDLKGHVNVSNHSGQDFDNTRTRLIVGETRLTEEIRYLAQRHYPYGPDIIIDDGDEDGIDHALEYDEWHWKRSRSRMKEIPLSGSLGGAFNGDLYLGSGIKHDIKQIEKTGLSEYFLYTIEGTEDLTNQWAKRLPSFDVEDVPVKSLYKYDDARYGKQPVRFVSFANDSEHELGETPIPEGAIKIYRNVNEARNLSYVGQSNIKYIPVNEDIELNLGPARLVKVEPTLMATQTENYTFNNKGNIDGWDDIETWKIEITNTREIPIDIEITWNMGTDSWELTYVDTASTAEDAIEYKKHDKSRGRFTMTVPVRSEKNFGMTIRKYRKKRIETYVQKIQEKEK